MSLAGLTGRPVRNQAGAEIGSLADVVARWGGEEQYPPVTGLVVRIGRRLAFVHADQIDSMGQHDVRLRSARLDLSDFERRPGEVRLGEDVLDHQLVDVDGVKVIRAADLYLAPVAGRILLVGADVSLASLARRLGPRRWRTRPTLDRVLDWAAIQPFGDPVAEVRLRSSHEGLRRLRPGELADLLEDLGRAGRQELLEHLEPETAADALEEMEPTELESLLREAPAEQAGALLAAMEPDEAVDALRDLSADERAELLGQMPAVRAEELAALLGYREDRAGGFMTTNLLVVVASATVADARSQLVSSAASRGDIDAVAVVDAEGSLVDDVSLFDLLVADGDAVLGDLADDCPPVMVAPEATVRDVADRLIESRRSSVLVVDEQCRPIGRILADDVVDALLPGRGRFHFPRLLQ
ncbi:MAG: CBS domain-containing protein [Actinomycetota bacterium]|nr:CBS domain-containing protein [Actinomycetota bacterium]